MSALKIIPTPLGNLILRRYEERDIPFHQAYLYDSPREFLEAVGFDTANRRPRSEFADFLKIRIAETAATSYPNALVAELAGRPIAVVPLDRSDYGDQLPRLHFHIFEAELRGRGLGGLILRGCAEEIAKLSGYRKFMIEPRATNARMNALLRKLGFRYVKDHSLPARPGVQAMVVSQYEICV